MEDQFVSKGYTTIVGTNVYKGRDHTYGGGVKASTMRALAIECISDQLKKIDNTFRR